MPKEFSQFAGEGMKYAPKKKKKAKPKSRARQRFATRSERPKSGREPEIVRRARRDQTRYRVKKT